MSRDRQKSQLSAGLLAAETTRLQRPKFNLESQLVLVGTQIEDRELREEILEDLRTEWTRLASPTEGSISQECLKKAIWLAADHRKHTAENVPDHLPDELQAEMNEILFGAHINTKDPSDTLDFWRFAVFYLAGEDIPIQIPLTAPSHDKAATSGEGWVEQSVAFRRRRSVIMPKPMTQRRRALSAIGKEGFSKVAGGAPLEFSARSAVNALAAADADADADADANANANADADANANANANANVEPNAHNSDAHAEERPEAPAPSSRSASSSTSSSGTSASASASKEHGAMYHPGNYLDMTVSIAIFTMTVSSWSCCNAKAANAQGCKPCP